MSIYSDHKPGADDGLYLKLKDGDKVKLRIASEPACSTYDGVKLRYAWIVWNRELNKPQVFSFGISIYSQVADLIDEWGEPTEFDVTVKRTGSGQMDTNYSVTPVKTSDDLTADQLKEVEKIDLPQAVKGRWLSDYVEDRIMPEVIPSGDKPATSSYQAPDKVVDDFEPEEPISLDDIPFGEPTGKGKSGGQ